MIVAVAVRYRDGLVISLPRPNRHCHILNTIFELELGIPKIGREQGFLTSEGNFVDRVTAGKIALQCGQIKEMALKDELISEDLW